MVRWDTTRRLVLARASELESHVWTGSTANGEVFAAIVDAALDEADGSELAAFAADHDHASIDVLRMRGFVPEGRRLTQWQWRAVATRPATPTLPDGYHIRGLRGPDEFRRAWRSTARRSQRRA